MLNWQWLPCTVGDTVTGDSGKYCDAVRIKLDGSKTTITLHMRYLSFEAES